MNKSRADLGESLSCHTTTLPFPTSTKLRCAAHLMPQITLPFYLDTRASWIPQPPPPHPIYLSQINYCYFHAYKTRPLLPSNTCLKGTTCRELCPAAFSGFIYWDICPLAPFLGSLQTKCFACTFDSPNWWQKATATYIPFKMLQNWPCCGFKIHVALSVLCSGNWTWLCPFWIV